MSRIATSPVGNDGTSNAFSCNGAPDFVGRVRTPRWVAYTSVPFAREIRTDAGVGLSSDVVAGSMVVVAPESKMIRGDKV
jgi:hypothetical protein